MNTSPLLNHTSRMGMAIAVLFSFISCEELPTDGDPKTVYDPPAVTWEFNLNAQAASPQTGDAFAVSVNTLGLEQRETAIYQQIANGNIPAFLRSAVPVQINATLQDSSYELIFYVMSDYLSIGTNDNYHLMPMTPILAQRVMDLIGGVLPTRKMVDLIWGAAGVKLSPAPIAPSAAMVTMPVFTQHNDIVRASRNALLAEKPLGQLVGGHKKDVILSNRIKSNPNKVVIYGWHYTSGTPIQPLYSGHAIWYADYSHGIRAVLSRCQLNGQTVNIEDILADPLLYKLLSDESEPMSITRYDTSASKYQ